MSALYVGIMSGTSLDGIDCVLIQTSEGGYQQLADHFTPYPPSLREDLLSLHRPDENELHLAQMLANRLGRSYADAVHALLDKAAVRPADVRAIGCHGQTIRHRPEFGYTIQLNNSALLAELTGILVVSDFRSRDIAAGGQGAPLVPAFHDRVLRSPSASRAIVNIGGISNLTLLPVGPEPVTGFDCGPGNLLMDAWISRHRGSAYDRNGEWAASGVPLPSLLERLLRESYFNAPPPKSCGRDLFNLEWLESHLEGNEQPSDVQATLLGLSARSIADSISRHAPTTREIWLCGGGAHNAELKRQLAALLPGCTIGVTDELGIGADWVEAFAFAWLAEQALLGIPANLPAVTGARHPCILGAIYPA